MIESHLKPRARLHPLRLLPRVIAAFSFRYDAHLVPALLENITPFVDGWVSFDDRQSSEAFSSEPQRRAALTEAALALGADWIFAVDPDERLPSAAVARFRLLPLRGRGLAWTFRFRELYAPDCYRVDGLWGQKRVARLFPARPFDLSRAPALHGHWYAQDSLPMRDSGLDLYHLKMIAPQRRMARARLYEALDPAHRYQDIGYAYLADEAGARFERIPPARMYRPAHVDDGGLWMPDVLRPPGA